MFMVSRAMKLGPDGSGKNRLSKQLLYIANDFDELID